MGYRSDVNVVFYTRKQETIPFAAIKLWFDENYPHEVAKTEWAAKVEAADDYVLVKYRSVKWYDGYEHVEAVSAAIRLFDETFGANDRENVAYEFFRVGEETSDIEEDHSTWSDFRTYMPREICFA